MVDTKSHSNSKNMILSGFMGCGKSSVGRLLAKRLGIIFLDTDIIIESNENRAIKKIFEIEGEAYFRNLERHLAVWLEKSVKNAVIATGGGFVIYNENIKNIGEVFFLDASLDTIRSRVNEQEKGLRPLFKEPEVVAMLYEKRMPIYKERSHYQIDANRSIEEIVGDILEMCGKCT